MRSGRLRLGIGRNLQQRFPPPALVRVLAAERKSVTPCEVRAHASGIHQNRQGLTRTIRLRNPDKCAGCHISPT
jgi:hypothetical protein